MGAGRSREGRSQKQKKCDEGEGKEAKSSALGWVQWPPVPGTWDMVDGGR